MRRSIPPNVDSDQLTWYSDILVSDQGVTMQEEALRPLQILPTPTSIATSEEAISNLVNISRESLRS